MRSRRPAADGRVSPQVLAASPRVRTHIVLPPTIYGIASHALVQKGISNAQSIQVPALVRASVERGQAGMVGKGANLWPNVHISDSERRPASLFRRVLRSPAVASAIATVFEAALAGKTATGREGYYFGGTVSTFSSPPLPYSCVRGRVRRSAACHHGKAPRADSSQNTRFTTCPPRLRVLSMQKGSVARSRRRSPTRRL